MPIEVQSLNGATVRRLKYAGVIAALTGCVIIASGIVTRLSANKNVRNWTDEQAVPTVSIVHPSVSGTSSTLTLPAQLEAFYNAPIYARVPGYLRIWYKDIGAAVHRGDTLAAIDTPDLDQQIQQAKGDLASAVASERLSQTTSQRWSSLLSVDAVSKQEAEEKAGDLATKSALVTAAKANLDRMEALKKFALITAPFDGVVTSRSVDIGALINAGASTTGMPLFTVADTKRIRVYVSVPQNYIGQVRQGLTATLTVPELPGKEFRAMLASTSIAINEKSNTLLVELIADNVNGTLRPGGFARVTLHLPGSSGVLVLPASTLIFRQNGLQVATVLPDHQILLKPVHIAVDLGEQVEINSGLNRNDNVVDNPPDSLSSGDHVRLTVANAASE